MFRLGGIARSVVWTCLHARYRMLQYFLNRKYGDYRSEAPEENPSLKLELEKLDGILMQMEYATKSTVHDAWLFCETTCKHRKYRSWCSAKQRAEMIFCDQLALCSMAQKEPDQELAFSNALKLARTHKDLYLLSRYIANAQQYGNLKERMLSVGGHPNDRCTLLEYLESLNEREWATPLPPA
jgi:hypothetical protein